MRRRVKPLVLPLSVVTKLIKHTQRCLTYFTSHMSYRDKTEMECRQNNEMEDSRVQDVARDPPSSPTGDRQTSKPMAFVSSLQRQEPLCCQIDEKARFAFLFVVALVLLLGFFYISFVSEGHILSNSSNLKWCDAFTGRSSKVPFLKFSFLFFMPLFISLFCTGISYLFMLPVGPLKCILCVFFFSATGYWDHLLFVLFE